jgi:hypothetical protein
VDAAEVEDADAIAVTISGAYRDSFHSSKERLIRHARSVLDEPLLKKVGITVGEIEIEGDKAETSFSARVAFEEDSRIARLYKQSLLARVRVVLHREDGRWLISRIELLEIDMQAVDWGQIPSIG